MKITIIHGQNRKQSSYHIGTLLANKMTSNPNDINEIVLPRDMPEFCQGCAVCILKDETYCPHYHYIEPLTKHIDEADLLIFTTPVYAFHASGSMKAFLDHYSYRWMSHRPEETMFSKQAVCISTAAGAGMKSAIKTIKDSLFYWGVARIYSYGVAVGATSWNEVSEKKKEKIQDKIEKLATKIKKKHSKVKPSIKTKVVFLVMRHTQSLAWNKVDNNYWMAKGWTDKKRPWKS